MIHSFIQLYVLLVDPDRADLMDLLIKFKNNSFKRVPMFARCYICSSYKFRRSTLGFVTVALWCNVTLDLWHLRVMTLGVMGLDVSEISITLLSASISLRASLRALGSDRM